SVIPATTIPTTPTARVGQQRRRRCSPNAHWCFADLLAVVCQLSTLVRALRQVSYVTAPVRLPGQATPGRRPSARAITAALVATVLVVLAGLVLTGLEWSSLATSDAIGNVGAEAGAVAYAALGALIVHRAGNLVGWFMLAEGAANAVVTTGSAYAIFGVKAHPGMLPAAAEAGTLAETVFVLVGATLSAIFLVFPSGRLPSPRWRPAAAAGLVLTGLSLVSFVVSTRQVALPAVGGISLTYPNPLAVRALRTVTWLGTLNGLALV